MEFRQALASELSKLMKLDEKIIVLDADLCKPDGLDKLFKEYPTRCIECGIQEANMVGVSAGLSAYGYKPIAVSFAPFITRRVFDQIAVSCAYAKQNVKLVGTDPGITAEANGGTHMTFEDIAMMRSLPNMLVYDAVDAVQLSKAIPQIMNYEGNAYIRMPRKSRPDVFKEDYKFTLGKADIVSSGDDITILATGTMVYGALLAKESLKEKGINAEVVSVNTIKPLDEETILKSIMKTKHVVTCENHNYIGGLYSTIAELLCKKYPLHIGYVAINDEFGQVGKYDELLKVYHLTPNDIVNEVLRELNK